MTEPKVMRYLWGATGMRSIEGDGYGGPMPYVRAIDHERAIDTAEARIAQARADAYEDAAKVCETVGKELDSEWNRNVGAVDHLQTGCDCCADAIRERATAKKEQT